MNVCGSNSLQNSAKLDNLIKCILESTTENGFKPYSLIHPKFGHNEDIKILSKINKVKELMFHSNEDKELKIDSMLIKTICSNIKIAQVCPDIISNKYVLLDESQTTSQVQYDASILYKDGDNFLILRKLSNEDKADIFTQLNNKINLLFNFELLDVICILKYNQKKVNIQDDLLDMDEVFRAFKEIKFDMEQLESQENIAKSFIYYLYETKCDKFIVSQKVIYQHLDIIYKFLIQIDELYNFDSIRSSIIFLKTMFFKRLQHMTEVACDRKREKLELSIKIDDQSSNLANLEIDHKEKKIFELEKEIAKKKSQFKAVNEEQEKNGTNQTCERELEKTGHRIKRRDKTP